MANVPVPFYFKSYARADLVSIRQYTIKQWGQAQWLTYKEALFNTFQTLANSPDIGITLNEISPDAYRFPLKNHVIYYVRKPDKIIIVGVLSSDMAPEKHLRREKAISDEL
ncbi:type II toxin-antitoxin system RelE/ParE family toxin [Bowmanella denitrificans]|uniref:type II toxin-antitoxin system RelE/ParE family toxin n=1 Tax=Bowmanella denitrificans TaxID=366582 RepID=UPI000C99F8AF|nr:type II toxin-antitoxin system RelE/ParE family toxin [Bowmanella denitrificans]